MQALQHAIYKLHLRRERARQEPFYDPEEDTYCHGTDEERAHIGGFNDPRNTVAHTVPIANEYGEVYGSRVQLISPEAAGKMIDATQEENTHLREALAEQRFWRKFLKRLGWASVLLNCILTICLIGG